MKKLKIIFICSLLFIPLYSVSAFSQYYEGYELQKEATITSEDNNLTAIIPADTFEGLLSVYLQPSLRHNLPDNLQLISQVYDFWLVSDSNISPQYQINLKFTATENYYGAKDVYIWQHDNFWQKVESVINNEDNSVTAEVTGSNVKIAVFEAQTKTVSSTAEILNNSDQVLEIEMPTAAEDSNYKIIFKNFDNLEYPKLEGYSQVSDVYEYDIKSEENLDLSKPLQIKINYNNPGLPKNIYYWDNNKQGWIELPSYDYQSKKYITTKVHFTYLRLALFEKEAATTGIASWYTYKNCDCAASRDYSKGTNLKVTNITEDSKNYGKSVIVTINDYGPEEWTKRVIDLDKTAYDKIANLSSGIMNVLIEQIND